MQPIQVTAAITIILFVQLVPKFSKANMADERAKIMVDKAASSKKEGKKKSLIDVDEFGYCLKVLNKACTACNTCTDEEEHKSKLTHYFKCMLFRHKADFSDSSEVTEHNVVLFVQLVPKFSKANMADERAKIMVDKASK